VAKIHVLAPACPDGHKNGADADDDYGEDELVDAVGERAEQSADEKGQKTDKQSSSTAGNGNVGC